MKHLVVTTSLGEAKEKISKIIAEAKAVGKEATYSDTAVQVEEDLYLFKVFTLSFPVGELEGFDSVDASSILDVLYGIEKSILKAVGENKPTPVPEEEITNCENKDEEEPDGSETGEAADASDEGYKDAV